MTLIQKLAGCHVGWTYCKWGTFDHAKPLEHLTYRTLTRGEWFADIPRRLRHWTAGVLCRWAARLNGHANFDLGYGSRGNRAAALEDYITMALVCASVTSARPDVVLTREEAEEIERKVHELAYLARATWWLDDPRDVESWLDRVTKKEPF